MPPLRERVGLSILLAIMLGVVFDGFQAPDRQIGVRAHHAAILAYRAALRPLIEGSTRCRFEVTCSEYSLRAVRTYGWPKGGVLTLKRLMACR